LKFLVDNALSPVVAEGLRGAGHDALHVRDYGMQAANDEDIFDRAAQEDRILISADTDFGSVLALRQAAKPRLFFFGRSPGGVRTPRLPSCWANLPSLLDELRGGCVAVFEEGRIRLRRLPIGSKV